MKLRLTSTLTVE